MCLSHSTVDAVPGTAPLLASGLPGSGSIGPQPGRGDGRNDYAPGCGCLVVRPCRIRRGDHDHGFGCDRPGRLLAFAVRRLAVRHPGTIEPGGAAGDGLPHVSPVEAGAGRSAVAVLHRGPHPLPQRLVRRRASDHDPVRLHRSPVLLPDRRCDEDRGFHHGVDVALPCGTPIRAGRAGTVVDPSRPGSPGAAYGERAFRLRVATDDGPVDVLIGHARAVKVRPGERVRRGEIIAEAGDLGAPDGCHLHFELRAADGGLSTATNPRHPLALHR